MRLQLRGKIIIPTLCLFIATMGLSLWYTQYRTAEELRSVVLARLQSELRTVTLGLSGARDAIVQDLQDTASLAPVQTLLSPAQDRDAMTEALRVASFVLETKPLIKNGTFLHVNFVDKSGKVVISSAKGPIPLAKYKGEDNQFNQQPELPAVADKTMFDQVMRGEVVFGGAVELEKNAAFIPVGVPVFKPGSKETIGMIEGYIVFSTLAKQYVSPTKIGKEGIAFVAGDRGVVFAHPAAPQIMVEPKPHFLTPKLVARQTGTHEYPYEGQNWIAVFDTVSQARWTVIVKVDADEVFHSITLVAYTAIIANALSLALIVVFLFVIINIVVKSLRKAVMFAEQVAEGDLKNTLEVCSNDEVGLLARALNRMVGNLRDMITTSERQTEEAKAQTERVERAVRDAEASQVAAEKARSEGIHHAASQLEALVNTLNQHTSTLDGRIQQVAQGAEEQQRQSNDNGNALNRMNDTVNNVNLSAGNASESAGQARGLAESGSRAVADVADSIQQVNAQAVRLKDSLNKLGSRAEDIGQIMNVISDIADQTNLLALNAAIEAARAGEAGRGFAVVADEVRKLAEKTMTATKEVGNSVAAIQTATQDNISLMDETSKTVDQTTNLATQAGESLLAIVSAVKTNAEHVDNIASASLEQEENSKIITRGVEAIDVISVSTTKLMHEAKDNLEEVAKTTHNLLNMLQELKK